MLLLSGDQLLAQTKAPIAASSRNLPDFLSRVRTAHRLETGDSVILHALALQGFSRVDRTMLTKCGTGVLGHAREISASSKDTWLNQIQAATPGYNSKLISPSGRFTVHYYSGDTAGLPNTRPEYAQAVARFADEAYDFEINELGYTKPPFSDPDSTYHIYLLQLGLARAYGYTDEVTGGDLSPTPSGLRRTRTFMVMDNDFLDSVTEMLIDPITHDTSYSVSPVYVTSGLDAARITVFHEFHHVVQFGSYGRNFADNWMQEMTSTWMEMLSDPEVDDYVQYVPGFTQTLTLRFDRSPGGGYGQAIYLEYLTSKFGNEVVRDIWDRYRKDIPEPVEAIAQTLKERNTSFACEYANFGAELFFTGRRTRGKSPFSDAGKFIDTLIEAQFVEREASASAQAFGTSLHLFWTKSGSNQIAVSVSRDTARLVTANIESLVIHGSGNYDISYDQPQRFCAASSSGFDDPSVFPQPFVVNGESEAVFIKIADELKPINSFVKILSVSMAEIITLRDQHEGAAGGYCVKWDGRDALGRVVPSGVYLFAVDADGAERSGKIVVIRK